MFLDHGENITDESGMPTFVFVPNYKKEQAKQDLKQLPREDMQMKKTKTDVEASTSESSSVDIPTLVMVDNDELSDISSLYHENDEDRLVTFVSAIMH
jgi:hypothetical protein